MLAVHNSVISKISVQSKKKCQSSKMSPSTQYTQSPQANSHKNNNFTTSQNYWDQSSETRRVMDLQKQIEDMEKLQLQMEAKFQQCVQSLLTEIQRNNNNNAKLATEVNYLKQQLTQSKKDILIIEEYMKANLKLEARNRAINEPMKVGRQSASKNTLASSSSSKILQLKRTPSKYFKSKLLQRQ